MDIYEYRCVSVRLQDQKVGIDRINKYAKEGFRVIDAVKAATGINLYVTWTLERRIMPRHPYRDDIPRTTSLQNNKVNLSKLHPGSKKI